MARIMIADDSDAIRMVLKDILKIGHHDMVSETTNGFETVQEYVKVKPDVLLLDLAMPKKDGISALKEILTKDPSAKIIMITASDNQNTIKECFDNGASAYILKPFDFEEVLKTITNVSRL